jgi:hypothetical protein
VYVIVACGCTVELTALCAVAVREERASREGEKHPLVSLCVLVLPRSAPRKEMTRIEKSRENKVSRVEM